MTDTNGHSSHNRSLLLFGSLILLVLSGCATVQQDIDDADTQPYNEEIVAAEEEIAADSKDEPEAPLRPFEPETLFDLLVGDMAGANKQYGLQLNRYRKQALATRDAGLAAQATWLAIQLNAAPQALELSQLWVSLQPESIEANRILSHYLAHSAQLAKALPHALITLQQDDTEAIHTIGRLIRDANSPQRSDLQDTLHTLTGNNGRFVVLADHPQVILLSANLLRINGDYQQAIDQASRIQQPQTSRESALLLIAQVLMQRDGADAALAALEQSIKEIPDSKRLRLQLARQWSEKDIERSRHELDKLVTQFPDDYRLSYSLALINAQMGMLEKAVALLQKLVDLPEYSNNANFQLGRLFEKQRNNDQAIDHYQQVQAGEHVAAAITGQIRLLAVTNRNKELQALIKQLRDQQPDKAVDIYLSTIDVLTKSQQLPQALVLSNQAVDEFPKSNALIYNRALIYEQLKNTEAAHQDFRTIIARDPNNAEALNALGYSLTNTSPANSTELYREAHQLISKAAELAPDNAAILDSLGWALFRLERYKEALPHLRRAFELFPDPEVAAHLGEVLWVMGNQQEALQVWQKSLADNPKSTHVTKTMDRLGIPSSKLAKTPASQTIQNPAP